VRKRGNGPSALPRKRLTCPSIPRSCGASQLRAIVSFFFNVTIVALMIILAANWCNEKSGLGDRLMLAAQDSGALETATGSQATLVLGEGGVVK
jgi:hypothetical protein